MKMNPVSLRHLLLLCALGLGAATVVHAQPATGGGSLDAEITELQHRWADAYYRVPEAQKQARFKELAARAEAFRAAHPDQAEPLIWQAIVLSSYAKFEGGLGALGKIKHARELLLAAEKIEPAALEGSVYTSLGSLYAKAPGWPVAFGDRKKAAEYLEKALAINPDGIDPNFFYGDLLLDQGRKAEAEKYLRRALMAPPRPGREDADAGRRAEIEAALAALKG